MAGNFLNKQNISVNLSRKHSYRISFLKILSFRQLVSDIFMGSDLFEKQWTPILAWNKCESVQSSRIKLVGATDQKMFSLHNLALIQDPRY